MSVSESVALSQHYFFSFFMKCHQSLLKYVSKSKLATCSFLLAPPISSMHQMGFVMWGLLGIPQCTFTPWAAFGQHSYLQKKECPRVNSRRPQHWICALSTEYCELRHVLSVDSDVLRVEWGCGSVPSNFKPTSMTHCRWCKYLAGVFFRFCVSKFMH